jgi:hypothetical protein
VQAQSVLNWVRLEFCGLDAIYIPLEHLFEAFPCDFLDHAILPGIPMSEEQQRCVGDTQDITKLTAYEEEECTTVSKMESRSISARKSRQ